jgi:hypothetical protein
VASRVLLHAGVLLGLFVNLKMKAKYSSETSVDFQRTTLRFIPVDNTLQNEKRGPEKLKNASCFMDSLSISYSIGFEVSNEFNMS